MARSGQAQTSPVRSPQAAAEAREERLSLRTMSGVGLGQLLLPGASDQAGLVVGGELADQEGIHRDRLAFVPCRAW
jgi:hypothetical protein